MTLQNGTIGNIKVGVCAITYGARALGFTQDGATVSITPTWEDVRVDEWAETPIDAIKTAEDVTVVVRLSEYSMDNLLDVLPGSQKVTDGSKVKVTGGVISGFLATEVAAELYLHPIKLAAGDRTEDVTIYKAYVSEAVEIGFMYNDVRSYEVTFRALIDPTKANKNHLFALGDSTANADTTAPTIASVSPIDGATGIAVSANVEVTMTDDDLDGNTVISDNVLLLDIATDTQVACTLSWASGTKIVTVNPDSNLAGATSYRLIMTTGVKDVNGNALATAFSSDFTTA